MELGIKKCAMFIMKSGKRQIMEGTELLNPKKHQNVWRKEKLQLLGNIRSGYHKRSRNEGKSKSTSEEWESSKLSSVAES